MSIRSGRFKFPNETAASPAPHVIVKLSDGAKSVAFYRILNSGAATFTVEVLAKNSSTVATKVLDQDQSVDVAVDAEGSVQVKWAAPNGAADISGIYNFLGDKDSISTEDVRSGRYYGAPDTGKVFVDYQAVSKAAAVYRIFNSGDEPFTIHSAVPAVAGNEIAKLNPKFSIDISPEEGGLLAVAGAAEIDVIYEFLAGAQK